MFKWFKKSNANGRSQKKGPQMKDLDGNPLAPGDRVASLRYDLGECEIIEEAEGLAYRSLETGKTVSYIRMIDAATTFQKVRKI
jgi:hypothetical protein